MIKQQQNKATKITFDKKLRIKQGSSYNVPVPSKFNSMSAALVRLTPACQYSS